MVAPHADPVVCGSCAVVRWLRVLDLVVTQPSNRVVAGVLKKAEPLDNRSPHLCRSTRTVDAATLTAPLLPPIDQWGYVPFPVQRLTPHSLSRQARQILAGDFGAHRDVPVDADDTDPPKRPAPVPAERPAYSRAEAQRAWIRRHADLEDLSGINDQLDQLDRQVAELNRRTANLLGAETFGQQTAVDVT
jgi:hypothetical protein